MIQEINQYKLGSIDKIKYYVVALNEYIKQYVNQSEKNNNKINNILDLIVTDYKNTNTESSDCMAKELFVIINELYKSEHYELAENILNIGKKISNKKIFYKLESSIKEKKKEKKCIEEISNIKKDKQILNENTKSNVQYEDNSKFGDIIYASIAIIIIMMVIIPLLSTM